VFNSPIKIFGSLQDSRRLIHNPCGQLLHQPLWYRYHFFSHTDM